MAFWSMEETFKFIEKYQNEPTIWNPKHKFYKDKYKVNDSWNRIADEMGIPVAELKKKKESLMTSFRTHLKKKKASERSGAAEDEIYKPIWVFYEPMEDFLKDIYECKGNISAEDDGIHMEHTNEQSEDNGVEEERPGSFQEDESEASQDSSEKLNRKGNTPTRKRRSNNPPELMEVNAKISCPLTTLSEVLFKKNNSNDDECVLYGKLLAIKLKQFSQSQRNELMYEIDGLIMRKRQAPPSSHRTIPFHIPQNRTTVYLPKQSSGDPLQQRSSSVTSNAASISNFRQSQDIATEVCEASKDSE